MKIAAENGGWNSLKSGSVSSLKWMIDCMKEITDQVSVWIVWRKLLSLNFYLWLNWNGMSVWLILISFEMNECLHDVMNWMFDFIGHNWDIISLSVLNWNSVDCFEFWNGFWGEVEWMNWVYVESDNVLPVIQVFSECIACHSSEDRGTTQATK